MGCDIHMYAEVKNTHTNKWEKVGNVFKSDYSFKEDELIDEPYEMRNYTLFSVLAGVRNNGEIKSI